MKLKGFVCSVLILFFYFTSTGQNKSIDVQHYQFDILLNDSNNVIKGNANIDFIIKQPVSVVYFDLTSIIDSTGKGMKVLHVLENSKDLRFDQQNNKVNIYFDSPLPLGVEKNISIIYSGIPNDGLIIDSNKYHHRTFFGDNWPNRAHNWIPCNDHPADKATVEFRVTAPDHYQVVANGVLTEEINLSNHLKLTDWKEDMVLPTKVMVIGVADFAVQLVSVINCIPITSWVFPENKNNGFKEYAIAKSILPFYINYIGDFPYKKLANVQSRTRFGGMENASNIFYFENSVAKDSMNKHQRPVEDLFAHEIAHQWFGDEASETDWPHVWLSEGFATYMTHLYIEYRYGTDSLKKRMQHERTDVIDFYKKRKTPVVDTSAGNDLLQLLNDNSYQKGSWVLHMLRKKLGNETFQKGIRAYYAAYKGKNASTDDLMHIMENVSQQNLKTFFKQWLYVAGQPVLDVKWKYDVHKKMVSISINQLQDFIFQFPLQLNIVNNNHTLLRAVTITNKSTTVSFPVDFIPTSVILDPDVNLLFEGSSSEEK